MKFIIIKIAPKKAKGFLEKLESSSKNLGNYKGSGKFTSYRKSHLLPPPTRKLSTKNDENLLKKPNTQTETISQFSDSKNSLNNNEVVVGKRKRHC